MPVATGTIYLGLALASVALALTFFHLALMVMTPSA